MKSGGIEKLLKLFCFNRSIYPIFFPGEMPPSGIVFEANLLEVISQLLFSIEERRKIDPDKAVSFDISMHEVNRQCRVYDYELIENGLLSADKGVFSLEEGLTILINFIQRFRGQNNDCLSKIEASIEERQIIVLYVNFPQEYAEYPFRILRAIKNNRGKSSDWDIEIFSVCSRERSEKAFEYGWHEGARIYLKE